MGQPMTERAELLAHTQDGALYKVFLPIMVLAFRDGHQAAVTMQPGEILEVVGPAQDDRFVIVDIKGEQCLVFECDLKDRGRTVAAGHQIALVRP